MANIFYTSDTHYFHDNIIKYCNRPFADVDEMNWKLVRNWNDRVGPNDTVYHLGDVAFRFQEKFEAISDILRNLNGKKYLIMGNHDTQIKKKLSMIHNWMPHVWHEVIIGPYNLSDKIVLNHYPKWDKEFLDAGGWHLHGHEHADNSNRPYRLLDVGVDAQNYAPISHDEVFDIMRNRREWIPGEEKIDFKREDRGR